jgi:hypothetical protein
MMRIIFFTLFFTAFLSLNSRAAPDISDLKARAMSGDVFAQQGLATAYDKGEGVPQDHSEASIWWKISGRSDIAALPAEPHAVAELRAKAEAGDAISEFNLCQMYIYERGVPKNVDEARKWCRKSAEAGYKPAQMAMVAIDPDMREAAHWDYKYTKDNEEFAQKQRIDGFEYRVGELLHVALNDEVPVCGTSAVRKVDMNERKKYFTDKGWIDYQHYVSQIKRHLDNNLGRDETMVNFIKGSKEYGRWDRNATFLVYGWLWLRGCGEKWKFDDKQGLVGVEGKNGPILSPMFSLKIAYVPREDLSRENVLIDAWDMNLFFREAN